MPAFTGSTAPGAGVSDIARDGHSGQLRRPIITLGKTAWGGDQDKLEQIPEYGGGVKRWWKIANEDLRKSIVQR